MIVQGLGNLAAAYGSDVEKPGWQTGLNQLKRFVTDMHIRCNKVDVLDKNLKVI